jgi:alpha-glucosidase
MDGKEHGRQDGHAWWQSGVIYQVYPRSFMDTDGDGNGDLRGVTAKLPYLRWLGVDAVWLSPVYRSPMADGGYDVSDYRDIDPLFGSLQDFDALVAEAHRLGLKVLMDFVPNHTSEEHPWFLESRSSRDNPKRDWYIWRDPAPDGGPPNNWVSSLGGGAWELDERTGQYYYHAFLKQQPDLNWRNPEVQEAMLDVMRFWLDRGVDGFRVDVIWHLVKDEEFRDNPLNPDSREGDDLHHQLLATYSTDRPEVHDVIGKMRRAVDAYEDRLLIGEVYLPVQRLVTYYGTGTGGGGVHLPFNFQLLLNPWRASVITKLVEDYEAALPPHGWPNWVLGNHDRPRVASRVGPAQARVAAMLLLTLRGTPTLYYGDEIGMHDALIPEDRVRDPVTRNLPGLGLGRDPQRTPMQWDGTPNAGFTRGTPWLPLPDDHATTNVAAQSEQPGSMLALHRALLALRRREKAFSVGAYGSLPAEEDVMAYVRSYGASHWLVALNISGRPRRFQAPDSGLDGVITLSTHMDRSGERFHGAVELRPDEGVAARLD